MENVPSADTGETQKSESTTTKKSRKKKAGDLGVVAAKSEQPRLSAAERAKVRWFQPERSESPEPKDKPVPKTEKTKSDTKKDESPSAPPETLNYEPVSEVHTPLEKINEQEEVPFAIRELAEAGEKRVAAEVTDGSPGAESARLAVKELYARVAENPENLDGVSDQLMNIMGAKPEQSPQLNEDQANIISEADVSEVIADDKDGLEPDKEDATEIVEVSPDGEIVFDRRLAETASAADSKSEIVDSPSPDEAEDTLMMTGRPSQAAGGGVAGGTLPPQGPLPPFGPGGAGGPGGPPGPPTPGGPGNFGGGFNPNLAPPVPLATTTANAAPRVPEYHDASPAAMALVGGIVGYLIGRRRGRIKSEKKLLPIQKKLEKQVVDLQWQLQEKESKIRKVAIEQAKIQGVLLAERINHAADERQARKQQVRQAQTREQVRELPVQRRPAPEAHQLHGSQRRQEQIGHILVAAESPLVIRRPQAVPELRVPVGAVEKKATITMKSEQRDIQKAIEKAAANPAKAINEHRAETMQRAELLAISEKITVDGSNLRKIYESHLVGERGLRRLVAEHLQGGDIKKALRVEIVEREIDFERDPAMRDLPQNALPPTSSGKTALDTFLQQAAASLPASQEEAAFFKARARYDAAEQSQRQKQRRLIDISLTSAIILLISAVIILYIRGM